MARSFPNSKRHFRGAGWNVIKVIWGSDWDPLFAQDTEGLLAARMAEIVDGEYQRFITESGAYSREKFFGADPRLLKMVEHFSTMTCASCGWADTIRARFTPPTMRQRSKRPADRYFGAHHQRVRAG